MNIIKKPMWHHQRNGSQWRSMAAAGNQRRRLCWRVAANVGAYEIIESNGSWRSIMAAYISNLQLKYQLMALMAA
jgi:hypothetical protein